ncbi:cryptochrome DASH, mitochondrial [Lecanosticta acicola]|uniref:Cryptochrome DASH n=1 Tax=Lecanosticta acicola TaxID=111012 RepID=A0AAI9EA65_9PEZI|nr:cryptochrome DASH, mitochondrial [Lecanosticta acicola]
MSRAQRVLVYLLRRDLRLADNPVFHELARINSQSQRPFTHLLPVYVFPADQVEVSGFLKSAADRSPYPEARSKVGGFWRCGKLRAKFLAESVWDLKKDLESVSSGLSIRVGTLTDAVRSILDAYRDREGTEIHGIWMTSEEGWEEKIEEDKLKKIVEAEGKEFKLWTDEKYFVDDRDLPFKEPRELSDVFTTFRKSVEPLRTAPRKSLPKPESIPPLPDYIAEQSSPFAVPESLDDTIKSLSKPLENDEKIPDPPQWPQAAKSAHPFLGGSTAGHERVKHLIESGAMTTYKDTRNGLLGLDFSTKLSAWLSLGCISARQVHWKLIDFEDGKNDVGKGAEGYGKGENKGTAGVRFELLWRDYMRLCTRKFGVRLFFVDGYRQDKDAQHKFISSPYTKSTNKKNTQGVDDENTRKAVERFLAGRTGTGLIDASQRELYLTGWTSNRARQNVASYLSKRLGIDWRIGAEFYEMNLIDYDVSSNWGNWQYVAGVGNDPRGDARIFNPVKQALDYDPKGEYIRTWVPELKQVGHLSPPSSTSGGGGSRESLMGVVQAWRIPAEEKKSLGLEGLEWVERPLIKIDFSVNRRGAGAGGNRGGRGGGGGGGGPARGGRGGGGGRGRGRGVREQN